MRNIDRSFFEGSEVVSTKVILVKFQSSSNDLMSAFNNAKPSVLLCRLNFQSDSTAACPFSHVLGSPSFGLINSDVLRNTKMLEPHPVYALCELFRSLSLQDADGAKARGMVHNCQHTLTSTYLTLLSFGSWCSRGRFSLGNC